MKNLVRRTVVGVAVLFLNNCVVAGELEDMAGNAQKSLSALSEINGFQLPAAQFLDITNVSADEVPIPTSAPADNLAGVWESRDGEVLNGEIKINHDGSWTALGFDIPLTYSGDAIEIRESEIYRVLMLKKDGKRHPEAEGDIIIEGRTLKIFDYTFVKVKIVSTPGNLAGIWESRDGEVLNGEIKINPDGSWTALGFDIPLTYSGDAIEIRESEIYRVLVLKKDGKRHPEAEGDIIIEGRTLEIFDYTFIKVSSRALGDYQDPLPVGNAGQ